MTQLRIDVNMSQVREIELMFAGIGNSAKAVLTRSINKTITGVRTDMTEEAYQVLNTTKKVIRDGIRISRANYTTISGSASRKGKPIALAKFSGTAQRRAGVSVKVLRAGARTILKHAFIATMTSGHVGVFWRKDEQWVGYADKAKLPASAYGRLPKPYRLPIKELYGPRVEDILAKPERWRNVEEKANERLLKNLDHEVSYELSRL